MTVEAELNGAIAELVREKGPRGFIYEHLKQAQALVNDLGLRSGYRCHLSRLTLGVLARGS